MNDDATSPGHPTDDSNLDDARPGRVEAASVETCDRSALSLIRDIQSGVLNPLNLSIEDRRDCVEHLTAEGFSIAEIVEYIKTPKRTVARDRQAVRKANSLKATPDLVNEMVGGLVQEAELCIGHLRRAVRGKEVAAADRIAAERDCWAIRKGLILTLQRLGYLPEAAHSVKADLTHHLGDGGAGGVSVIDAMNAELERLAAIAIIAPDLGVQAKVEQLRQSIKEVRIVNEVQVISATVADAQMRADEGFAENAQHRAQNPISGDSS